MSEKFDIQIICKKCHSNDVEIESGRRENIVLTCNNCKEEEYL